jgi:hypothetical protein
MKKKEHNLLDDPNPYMWIVALCLKMGYKETHKLEKPLEVQIDDQWSFKFNGKPYEVDGIPKLNVVVSFEGYPTGVFSVEGGVFIKGTDPGGKIFKRALLKKLASIK